MLAAAPKRRRPGPLGKNLLLGEEVRTCVTRSQGREFSHSSLGVVARAPGITARTASAFGERFPALPGAAPFQFYGAIEWRLHDQQIGTGQAPSQSCVAIEWCLHDRQIGTGQAAQDWRNKLERH